MRFFTKVGFPVLQFNVVKKQFVAPLKAPQTDSHDLEDRPFALLRIDNGQAVFMTKEYDYSDVVRAGQPSGGPLPFTQLECPNFGLRRSFLALGWR